MKRLLIAVVCFAVMAALVYSSAGPVLSFFARRELKKSLQADDVDIGSLHADIFRQIIVSNLKIQKKGFFRSSTGLILVRYSLPSLLSKKILNVTVKDVDIIVDEPKKDVLKILPASGQGGTPPVSIERFYTGRVGLSVKTKDFSLNAESSGSEIDLVKGIIKAVDLAVKRLEYAGLSVEDLQMRVPPGRDGHMTIREVKYNKVSVEQIESAVSLKGKDIAFEHIGAKLLDGKIGGEADVALQIIPEYRAAIKISDVDIEKGIEALELTEKVEMDGRLSGTLSVVGAGSRFRILAGDLKTTGTGHLVIKDRDFLENLASRSTVPKDILIESLQDYDYNSAGLKMSLEEKDLLFRVNLDGSKGKRQLEINYHDFQK